MHIRQLSALLVFALGVLFFLSYISGSGAGRPFVSTEMQFSDGSSSGLSIVPASCPSSPHYAGECGVGGGGYGGGSTPTISGNACVIGFSPSTIMVGGSSLMAWNSDYRIFNIPFSLSGVISPGPGSVAGSGITTVSPSVSTTYTGTFTPTGSLDGIPSNWLTPVTCSSLITVLQSNPGPTNCSVQNFCVGASVYRQNADCTNTLVQTCTYGCSNGVCLGAPSPTAFIRLRPSLVRSGEATTVEWSASQVSSCTVTEDNPAISDSWSGSSGSQTSSGITSRTTYTLSCTGLDASSISRTAEVNISPVPDEQ